MSIISGRLPSCHDFQVAVICALWDEAQMVELMLDKYWSYEDLLLEKAPGDHNTYTLGSIGRHNVVIAFMPGTGSNSAVAVASGLRLSFPGLELAFVVGICGVSPIHPGTREEIVLGDCIIGTDIVQYDFGKQYPGKFTGPPTVEDILRRARPGIKSHVAKLRTLLNRRHLASRLLRHLEAVQKHEAGINIQYPGTEKDLLFEADYLHSHHTNGKCEYCIDDTNVCARGCKTIGCEDQFLVGRKRFAPEQNGESRSRSFHPAIHFGIFGSANTVMKSGIDRERLTKQDAIAAFEMEGSGIWEILPTMIIKAACDYADSHKSKEFRGYATAVAAAGLKAVLEELDLTDRERRVLKNSIVPLPMMGFEVRRIDLIHKHPWFSWLEAPIPVAGPKAAPQEHHPDAGGWLLNHAIYKDWVSKRSSMLWLYGISWSGKTVLCTKVLQEIQKTTIKKQKCVLFFYFDDKQRQSTHQVLQEMLRQLHQQNPARSVPITRLAMDCIQRQTPPSDRDLSDALMEMLDEIGHTYLIIDALDDCSDRDNLLNILDSCISDHGLSTFVTSRQQYATESSAKIRSQSRSMFFMSAKDVNLDIRQYVGYILQDRGRFGGFPRPILGKIESELFRRSNGCFGLATGYLEEIKQCLNLTMLELTLARLPRSLNEGYGRMLMNIDEKYIPYAIRLLQFLVFWAQTLGSDETLGLHEAVDLLAVEPSKSPAFDKKLRMFNPLNISKVCGNLVMLSHTTGSEAGIPSCVQLAHPSIKQFLQSDAIPGYLRQHFEKDQAQSEINTISIAYLSSVISSWTSSTDSYSLLPINERGDAKDLFFLRKALWMILGTRRAFESRQQKALLDCFRHQSFGFVMQDLGVYQLLSDQIMGSLHESRKLLYCARDTVWDAMLGANSIAIRVTRASIYILGVVLWMVELVAIEQPTRDAQGSRWTVLRTPTEWTECFGMAWRATKSKNILVPRRLSRSLSYPNATVTKARLSEQFLSLSFSKQSDTSIHGLPRLFTVFDKLQQCFFAEDYVCPGWCYTGDRRQISGISGGNSSSPECYDSDSFP